jgi:hypothetical protein
MNVNKALVRICQKHNIKLVYLLGSQVEKGLKILQGEKVSVSDPLTIRRFDSRACILGILKC